jgi:hypothetical protein
MTGRQGFGRTVARATTVTGLAAVALAAVAAGAGAAKQVGVSRAVTLDSNKHDAHRGERVRLAGRIESPDQAACADNQTVELQRENRRTHGWKTIGEARSDTSGVFEFRYRLRRNAKYEFRAFVAATVACGEGVSNTDHVHVEHEHEHGDHDRDE